MLKNTFLELLKRYSTDEHLANELWREIETNYSNQERYYHTLDHLNNLLNQLQEVDKEIVHFDTLLFTLYYHDIIYNSLNSDNEEKSAQLAVERMNQLGVNEELIKNCENQILATKSHDDSINSDTNIFLDADLSVLGQSWADYSLYYQNIRQEYSIYTDEEYNAGRKKVLRHFLAMTKIFKTDYFYTKFEKQAKFNLEKEIQLLDSK